MKRKEIIRERLLWSTKKRRLNRRKRNFIKIDCSNYVLAQIKDGSEPQCSFSIRKLKKLLTGKAYREAMQIKEANQ